MNVKHLAQYLTPYRHTAAAAAKSLQLCPTLFDPIDSSPPGSSVPGSLQARILEWDAISFCNACMPAKSLQSCPTLCHPMDSSPPGSPVHGILWQEYWSGLPFPSPGDLSYPRIKPTCLMSPELAGGFFTTSAIWEAWQDANARNQKEIITTQLSLIEWVLCVRRYIKFLILY